MKVSWIAPTPSRTKVNICAACDDTTHAQPQGPSAESDIACPSAEHEQFALVQKNLAGDSLHVQPQSDTPAAAMACPVIEHKQSSAAHLVSQPKEAR